MCVKKSLRHSNFKYNVETVILITTTATTINYSIDVSELAFTAWK